MRFQRNKIWGTFFAKKVPQALPKNSYTLLSPHFPMEKCGLTQNAKSSWDGVRKSTSYKKGFPDVTPAKAVARSGVRGLGAWIPASA
jgi:hypothetical protein